MGRHEEIEQLLITELNETRIAYEIAQKALSHIPANTPSGLPQPDEVAGINRTASANDSAKNAWIEALRQFGCFILQGTVPDRFREADEIQPEPLSSVTTPRSQINQDSCVGVR
jgi:hypothetical protein